MTDQSENARLKEMLSVVFLERTETDWCTHGKRQIVAESWSIN